MKKGFKIIVLSVVIGIIVLLSESVYRKAKARNIVDKNTATMPSFTFTELNNSLFSDTDIRNKNGKVVINYFNPDCEHCQYMAKNYLQHADKLKNLRIIMVTLADSTSTTGFVKRFELNTLPGIVILRDTKFQFEKIFGPSIVPSFFIYDSRKLIKKITGETRIENLLN